MSSNTDIKVLLWQNTCYIFGLHTVTFLQDNYKHLHKPYSSYLHRIILYVYYVYYMCMYVCIPSYY
jgi:hypothetical protein